jgi:AraC-like DNA-binding protein
VDGSRAVLPTVTGFAVKQAIGVLRKHNIAVAPLLKRAGVSEYDISVGDGTPAKNRISAVGQAKFLEYVAEAIDDSAFGLHLAEQSDPRDVGVLFYVAAGAKDISEALTLTARYLRIVNEAVHLKLKRTPENLAVESELIGLPRHSVRQNVEFGMAVILKALRDVAGRNIRPTRAAFVHARNSDLREFERFYLCPVEFGRAANEGVSTDLLEFSNDTLSVPLVTADPKLLQALQPFCNEAAKERRTPTATLRSAVENEAERLLPHGKMQKRNIAKALGLSERTLSRRLAEEGTTFDEVVDQLRRSLAVQYLKEPGIALSQISWLLGYQGSTSFNHAFRRWTGRSPAKARIEKLLSAPA